MYQQLLQHCKALEDRIAVYEQAESNKCGECAEYKKEIKKLKAELEIAKNPPPVIKDPKVKHFEE